MNKSVDYHHRASKELIGLIVLSQAENILERIDPLNANVDVLNQGIARPNSDKVGLHAENERRDTKQPECIMGQNLCYAAQTSHQSAASMLASSNSSELSNASRFAVDTSDNNVLSRESFASSIKRSFELLNSVDLHNKNDRKNAAGFILFWSKQRMEPRWEG